jgi:hypothetical protein
VHDQLRYVCRPPGIDGWLNVALLNGRLGVWHAEQFAPKWFAGALWQLAQELEPGWLKAQERPGCLWQL